jgi:hypothetical protein
MKKFYKNSIRLHWVVFLCFLLPFFYDGCAEKKHEEAATDTDSVVIPLMADTLLKTESMDTSNSQLTVSSSIDSSKTDDNTEENSKDYTSEKISNKHAFFKPFLNPEIGVYSGIACIIDDISSIYFFAIVISFLFLLTSIIVKFIDEDTRKVIVLLDTIALFFLSISGRFTLNGDIETLWGFWVCLFCLTVLTLYDLYLIKIKKDA